ncbi:MAG: 4Fe-4S binding protein [Chloroflexi bacterium]|nr:4Fe-4S binding protein [Chloroflexota bacterium]
MPTVDFTKAQAALIPVVDADRCRACRRCVARSVCRSKAILRIDREDPAFIDASLCYACHSCVPACPNGAIRLPANHREPLGPP